MHRRLLNLHFSKFQVMSYNIEQTNLHDLPMIFHLFDEAILFQRNNKFIGWESYDEEYLKGDVLNGLLYKVVQDEVITGIFSVCYSDALIWREKEKGDAIYLHRIVLNRNFKSEKLFTRVLAWATSHARETNRKFIRMDTWADNVKIIDYYKSYGFEFVENYTTADTEALPVQHRNLTVALLELKVDLDKVKLTESFSTIDKIWTQKIIGEANGQLIKLAKGKGEINWHKHDDQDEVFILYKGHMTIQLRNKDVELFPNELFIVPKGVEHCPISHGESEFLIMGLNITSNTAGGRPVNADLLTNEN